MLPRAGRYTVTDRNRGDKRHNNIYDSTPTRALRILAAGMQGGITNPSRPWFRLTTSDPNLAEYASVKEWLDKVARLMRLIFERSNTYRTLHTLYGELAAFGTAATIVADDFDTVLHHHALTVGEYAVSTSEKGAVNTIYREFQMTVGQAAERFGEDKLSRASRDLYTRGNLDAWITICHAIEPRRGRDYRKQDNRNMPFRSCYFEAGSDNAEDGQFLSESGFREFPALAPRWETVGGDIYGHAPGMDALGDIKQLQHEQLRKGQGIDYQTKPPLQVPVALKNHDVDTLPGGLAYVDQTGPQNAIRSMFDVNLNLQHLLEDIVDVRARINQIFYVDLFLMLANDTRSGTTAREIAERHEEKLIMLGPTLDRLNTELIMPLVDLTFSKIVRADLLPPPPEELQGSDLRVEFVGLLAQAQRAVGLGAVDRLLMTVGTIAQAKGDPSVWDKVDTDQAVDKYSDMLGVDPDLIVADDRVAFIRQQRADQQAAMQQAAAMPVMAEAAKKLSETDTESKNALTDMARMG